MGASPDTFCPLRPALPTKEFDDISCHAWHGNKMPYPPAPSGRIDSTAAIRSPKTAPPNALSEMSAVLREQMPDSRVGVDPRGLPREPTRSCLLVASLRQSMCGEAGPKRTKYATLLIRGRAVVARGALRRIAPIGRCHTLHRTRQTSQPGSGDALDNFSACDDHQKRSGSQRRYTHRGIRLPAASNTSRS